MLQDSAKVVVYEPTPNILTIRFFWHLLFTEVVWIVLLRHLCHKSRSGKHVLQQSILAFKVWSPRMKYQSNMNNGENVNVFRVFDVSLYFLTVDLEVGVMWLPTELVFA